MKGLRKKDIDITFLGVPRKYKFREEKNVKLGVLKILYRILYMNLYALYIMIKNTEKISGESHVLMLSYSNFLILPTVLLSSIWGKKVSLDSHGSVFFTQVLGRKYVKKNSKVANLLWLADKISIKVCDEYLVFTRYAKKVLSKIYLERKKDMKVVYTGTLRPSKKDTKIKSGIAYWGNFINFHGVEKFIDSIEVLRKEYGNFEKVILMGKGEKKKECEKKVEKKGIENVEFLGFVSKSELEKRISQAKITVGVFGENKYMDTCITNKVCEAAARGKTIITKESPAIRELFEDKKSIIMTHKNDINEMAKDMHDMLKNEKKINYIGANSKKVFEGNLTPEKVAGQLLDTQSH